MNVWPHSPLHLFNSSGIYIVTGSTLGKQLFFKTKQQLDLLQDSLYELALKYCWRLEAWAIFPNHYHFIAHSPDDPSTLRKLVTHLHACTAKELNRLENMPGRKIWYQYWDTQLTFEKSYLARLQYVMNNPVKHHIVKNAEEYRWCSAKWFYENAKPVYYKIVTGFKIDAINIEDDFY